MSTMADCLYPILVFILPEDFQFYITVITAASLFPKACYNNIETGIYQEIISGILFREGDQP